MKDWLIDYYPLAFALASAFCIIWILAHPGIPQQEKDGWALGMFGSGVIFAGFVFELWGKRDG